MVCVLNVAGRWKARGTLHANGAGKNVMQEEGRNEREDRANISENDLKQAYVYIAVAKSNRDTSCVQIV